MPLPILSCDPLSAHPTLTVETAAGRDTLLVPRATAEAVAGLLPAPDAGVSLVLVATALGDAGPQLVFAYRHPGEADPEPSRTLAVPEALVERLAGLLAAEAPHAGTTAEGGTT